MGKLGQALGSLAGGLGSMLMPIPGVSGAELGGHLGNMLFRRGGAVKARARGGAAKKRGGAVKKAAKKRGGAAKRK